jgi:hypothetical protein
MHTPNIGERYRDTARFLQAQRDRDADREDFITGMIMSTAYHMNATIFEIERATAAGVKALADGRSRGYAIAMARQQLPKRRNVSTAHAFGR